MNEPLDSRSPCLDGYPSGGLDMHGIESLLSVLDVETDGIYRTVCARKRSDDRMLVVNVGLDRSQARIVAPEQPAPPIRVSRGNPNGKLALPEMSNGPAAQESGSAEHGDDTIVGSGHGLKPTASERSSVDLSMAAAPPRVGKHVPGVGWISVWPRAR
jgi:hypothetical protein